MEETELLRKKIKLEQAALRKAEHLLEQRTQELQMANQKLQALNSNLEAEVERKTSELERQKERYQMLVDSAQDIIFVVSRDGFFRYINPYGRKLIGLDSEDFRELHFKKVVRPDYLEIVSRFYRRQITEKIPTTYLEFPIVCSDGREIWVGQNVRLQIIGDEVVEWTAIARDISERISKDQEIDELHLRLSTLLYTVQEAVLVEDASQCVTLVNQAFCDLWEIWAEPADLVGLDVSRPGDNVLEMVSNPEEFLATLARIRSQRVIVNGIQLHLLDGRILERDYVPIFEGDRYIGCMWRFKDITREAVLQARIKASEEKYRGIIENMKLGLLEVDADGVIVKPYWTFCELTGYQPEELIGREARKIFVPDEYMKRINYQEQRRRDGHPGVYEIRIRVKDGSYKWVLISGAPFYDENGKMTGSIGIHFDITHQKQLQQELEMARQEAERAREAEKDFLANISHEIRNPINAVVGMTNLLFDTPLSAEQRQYLDNIKYSSDILLALISDILDLSKISEGKMKANLQVFNLEGLSRAIGKMTDFRLRHRNIAFSLSYDDQIPVSLITDTTFLNQILMNLLGNAVKFTHEGSISLKVSLVEGDESTATVRFEVCDTGIGIPAGQLPHIFDRFSQAGKATARRYGGTGLGLPITKKLIEQLGGFITVESHEGKGTCFAFELTLERALSLRTEKAEVPGTRTDMAPDLAVLIVEDNPVNRLYLEQTLRKWNFRFHSCQNGAQALRQLRRQRYDLILMDIRMPDMDGYETTIRLRSDQSNSNCEVPIIALTASALKDEKEKALAAGMSHHLTKPFAPDQLREAISRFYPLRQAEQVPVAPLTWPEPLRTEELQGLYGDDRMHARMMMEIFAGEMPDYLRQLRTYAEKEDFRSGRELAHQVKPHFGMIGRSDLTQMMDKIEDDFRKGKPAGPRLGVRLQEMTEEVGQLLPAIHRVLYGKNDPIQSQ